MLSLQLNVDIPVSLIVPFTVLLLVGLLAGGTGAVAAQGSSFDDAAPLTEGTINGNISAGSTDFYQVEANTTDALDVRLTPDVEDLEYYVYDSNREEIGGNGFVTSDETARLTRKLSQTGTYYIEVTGNEDSTTTDYTLNTDIVTPTENDVFAPNDDFESAAGIDEGLLDATVWGGESDFYLLEANTTDALDIRFTPQSTELEIYVYDRNRETIASDGFASDGETTRLTRKLPQTGMYYIEVAGTDVGTTTDYTLNTDVVTPTENDPFAPNDDFESAAAIEKKFTDATIWGGESDFYQVEANATDALDVRLTPQSSDLEYYIYDNNRETIASDSYVESGATDRLTKKLSQNETHYIEVVSDDEGTTTEYTLNTEVISPSQNDAFAPNDGFDSAAIIQEEFSDAKIWGGESDFYRVGLNAQETWTIDLTTQQADMEFFIYAPNRTELADDRFVRESGELSITASQAGTYYLEATTDGSEATTDYSIQSTQTGDSNMPPTAAFTTTSTEPTASELVTFDAGGSIDLDGRITSYAWDFNGNGTVGSTVETATTTHTYNSAGNYDVTLTVTDDSGATATTTESISVSPPEDTDPETGLPRFDQNGDDTINREEAVAAVIAYNTDGTVGDQSVGREMAVEVIIAYNTDRKISI